MAVLLVMAMPFTASAQTRTIAVEAGPIWSNADAQSKCPTVAKTDGGTWNGQWRTTVPGRMSVCEITFAPSNDKYVVETVEAGPIWSQSDADRKCPAVAKTKGGTWTGQWRTTVPGMMSVCEIRFRWPKG